MPPGATKSFTAQQLRGLGESQTLEFKRSAQLQKEAFADLCGMVNAVPAHGTVVFGIDPAGQVCGLGDTNLDTTQQTLALHAKQKFDPFLPVAIEAADCDGMPVLLLTATRSRAVPFHEYGGRAYLRVGSFTRQLTVAEKQQFSVSRNRDLHNGPWKCDRCGMFTGQVSVVEVTAQGLRRMYRHLSCGGEWWPAA
jgi:predicted HTH transcriptional regulator